METEGVRVPQLWILFFITIMFIKSYFLLWMWERERKMRFLGLNEKAAFKFERKEKIHCF